MLEFLNSYLTDKISTVEFKETFDQKPRKEWNCFGFKGLSGGMFLNKLVNHISDRDALTDQLRSALKVPQSTDDGHRQMSVFLQFLEEQISSNQVTKQEIQPARTPFFISAWWHIQATELWPVFYPRTRLALELEGLYTPAQDAVKDYFTFRESYLSLAKALELSSWNLEHLFDWQGAQNTNIIENGKGPEQSIVQTTTTVPPHTNGQDSGSVNVRDSKAYTNAEAKMVDSLQAEEVDKQVIASYTHIQWLLAKIGQRLGCKIWIASNDQNREWKGERLGDLSMKALPPLWMDNEFQRIIGLIDVLWLKGAGGVAAAFEVEHTTSIYSGLLRMSDLVTSYPAIAFPLFIVTPEIRLDKVRHELSRPTFQTLELHKRCGFFSEEKLIQEANNIMQWASSPSVIDKLAERVGDVNS